LRLLPAGRQALAPASLADKISLIFFINAFYLKLLTQLLGLKFNPIQNNLQCKVRHGFPYFSIHFNLPGIARLRQVVQSSK
jgi:hypothetical protein